MRAKDQEALLDRKVRTRVLASMLTCKICNKLIKESTALADCLHSFCQKCIYKEIYEEKSHNCPDCNAEMNGSLLRPDVTMRSLKVSLLGVHKRTPEQRAESTRMKFENLKASDDQAKKSQYTNKLPITYKDKGKAKVINEFEGHHRILSSQSPKKGAISYMDKYKIQGDEPSDLFQVIYGSKKGIVIRSSPPRSPPPPPPPVHENEMISSKSKGKRPMQEMMIPMDNEKMAVTATVLGSKSKEPKRRVRQKRVATPANGTMISPQDVIDAGKNIYPEKRTHYAWFILAPSEEQNSKEPLPPLMEPIVSLKNSKEPLPPLMEPIVSLKFDWKIRPTVSTLMKYIAIKLKLDSREKVGIYMFGGLLSPEMKVVDVVNQWMEIVGPERETTNIGTSAHHLCIQLTYA